MTTTMTTTKTTLSAVASAAARMTCSAFAEAHDEHLELLDADNLMDLNEGTVNFIYTDEESGEHAVLFYEGELMEFE